MVGNSDVLHVVGKEMGSQTPTSSERTRTNWTPTMEQYFIDLMLDQMHRGNRLGHTFNKQAWADMLTMFNAKFGCRYDRDTLKSHYTILWKQYNDVKNLLDQSEFSWDDASKMVVADTHVWDAYIKAQPDAQIYRNKALMNFNDLCLIYAYTKADGRYSRSSHDIDFDDDIQGLSTGAGTSGIAPATVERSKTDWTAAMDQCFIELMLVEIKKGNNSSNTFSKQAWKDMLTSFNETFCSQYGKSFLRHRHKKLLKYYTDIRSLLKQKGFSWDEKRQIIVADDVVWDKYVKAHPDARSYRNRTLLNYQDLCAIYGNVSNNELWGLSIHEKNSEEKLLQAKIVGRMIHVGEQKPDHFFARGDILKACWTPSMDCYLTDLLLDQALRGNKIGHLFITEAWTEMVTMFNAKFGSQFGSDKLKRRYKYLRRQYNDIKILLEHSGFYWDDIREMVTAEDYVWDYYIKEHPEARSYINKNLPSYHKLCVIYGQESYNGRCRELAHKEDLDSEEPDLMNGDETQSHANFDCLTENWTPSMDRYLIDLMLEQVRKGNMIDYSFKNEAWIDMAVAFVERFGVLHDKDLLRGRHKHLKKLYNDMKNLLDHRGFSWDEKGQLVTAYDGVWDAFIKEQPDAKSYRAKPQPNYNDLCLIYGNSTSCGRGNQSSQTITCDGDDAKLNKGSCQKTDWTPQMDRYFIDLMLEQVRQGNMVDQKFNNLAWEDMVEKFSAEFGSQHDKEVLRSRFMNLRKRFSDMTNLLDQSGFAWDEMQQMVTADDHLWDAYVKEHPDARSYRSRSLPSYNDLFLIYGNEDTNEMENRSCHSVDFENLVLVVSNGEEDEQSPASSGPLGVEWTRPMQSYFIELMLEQVHRGNKIGHTFNERGWTSMIASFNEKFGLLLDKDVLENQYLRLMKQYRDLTDLLNQNGFTWDEIQQTVVTTDDDVWEGWIKDRLESIPYNRNLGIYEGLHMIFSNNVPLQRSISAGMQMEVDNNPSNMVIDGVFGDLQFEASGLEISHLKRRRSGTSSISNCPRKVQRPSQQMQETPDEKPDVFGTPIVQEVDEDHSSIQSIVDALQAIPGMDDELFLEACKLLEDERRVQRFVTMDVNKRRKWLLRKLRP